MKYCLDLHTHTIVSGHAYSTLVENAEQASKIGLKILGTTDHGPSMPGGPHEWFFGNYRVLPREMFGVKMLYGCEANILDKEGNIDIPEERQEKMDIIIASLHEPCFEPSNRDENTQALLNVMENSNIDIIGHCGNPVFPIWEEEVVKRAKEKNIIIEINNSSFKTSRVGSDINCIKIAGLCKEVGTKIVLSSDSHFCNSIGIFDKADEVIKKVQMPESLIINTDERKIIEYLQNKGKVLDIKLD